MATEIERDPLAEACAWLVERRQDRGIPRTFEVIVTGMREAEAHVAALVECAEEQGRQVAALRELLREACELLEKALVLIGPSPSAREEVAGGDGA